MSAMAKMLAALCAALIGAGVAMAQEASLPAAPMERGGVEQGPGPGPFGDRIQILGFGGLHGGKVVTGAPFSAVATTETIQTLQDGTTITHKTQANLDRDGQGRFRKEITVIGIGPLAAQGQPRTFIVIQDPVAGTSYVLEPDQKIARLLPGRMERKRQGNDAAPFRRLTEKENVDLKEESLGTQTINGVSAEGTRYTRTIPAGQIGNDKPITVTSETWYSPELQLVVMSKRNDPRFGKTTYMLTNIQRAEPPTNLFSVPSDYRVKRGLFGRQGRRMRHGAPPPPPSDSSGPEN
jgi:hypothetical protein